jgi:hypothetical protein
MTKNILYEHKQPNPPPTYLPTHPPTYLGRCKLRWLKHNNNPNPKTPYFNTKMEKNTKKPILNELHVMINQLIKSI